MIAFLVNIFLAGILLAIWLIVKLVKWIANEIEANNTPESHKLTADEIMSWYDWRKKESDEFYKDMVDSHSRLDTLKRIYG